MIFLAEFCKCGSLVIGGRCTNKNCTIKALDKGSNGKEETVKKRRVAATAEKVAKPRRSSKVVTYNLNETEEEGNVN